MRHSNFITLIGNLGSEVDLKGAGGNLETEIARFSIAENVRKKNDKSGQYETAHTNWFPVTAFGSLAIRASKDLKKGDRILVTGTLKTSSYEKDGETRRSFEVLADGIEKAEILSAAIDEVESKTPAAMGPAKQGAPMGKAAPVVPKQSVELERGGLAVQPNRKAPVQPKRA